MVCPAIDNLVSCKICTVIHFLHAKNISAEEIHHELCEVYKQNVISEGTVRRWCRMFKDGQTNFMMKSEVVDHLKSVMILFKVLTKKFVKDSASQFQKWLTI
jgi:hypothetical protein